MQITDEMVDTAIKAEAAQARVRHPEIARFPDDYDEDEIVAVRLGMRAALETVLPMILAEVIEKCAREDGELQPIETAPKDGGNATGADTMTEDEAMQICRDVMKQGGHTHITTKLVADLARAFAAHGALPPDRNSPERMAAGSLTFLLADNPPQEIAAGRLTFRLTRDVSNFEAAREPRPPDAE